MQKLMEHAHPVAEKAAAAGTVTATGATAVGMTIGQVNEYLQAAAFCGAILSGCGAFAYYAVSTYLAWRKRDRA